LRSGRSSKFRVFPAYRRPIGCRFPLGSFDTNAQRKAGACNESRAGRFEEAASFYTSIFKNSKIGAVSRYGEEAAKASGRAVGSAMVVMFQLNGQDYMALNGGPQFKFSEAISFVVNCESQEEVDHFWEKLSDGGRKDRCGWLKDKFGVSWQIVPTALAKLMSDPDPQKRNRVMQALLQMDKLDINALRRASNDDPL
jgi:predicted 3-demethylubiquinone-9 3-methyltransferase (glyoxalase superfamily)